MFTDELDPALPFRDAKERAIERWERWYIARRMRHTAGNRSEAVRVAHSDRGYLRKAGPQVLAVICSGPMRSAMTPA